MDIIKFSKMIKEDFLINRETLNDKIYHIPNLHSKYLKYFYEISNKLIDLETERDTLYIKKRKYYLNKTDEIIKDTQVKFFIEGDEEYSALINKIRKKELKLKIVDDALKRCGTISFFVKNIIDYENFLVGK